MKILRRVNGGLGGIVSVGVGAPWSEDCTSISLFRAWFKVTSRDQIVYGAAPQKVPYIEWKNGGRSEDVPARLSCHSEERSDEESGFLRLEKIPGALATITSRPDLNKRNLLPSPIINANLQLQTKTLS